MTKKVCDCCGADITASRFLRVTTYAIVEIEEVGEPEESAIDYIATEIRKTLSALAGKPEGITTKHLEICTKCEKKLEATTYSAVIKSEEEKLC